MQKTLVLLFACSTYLSPAGGSMQRCPAIRVLHFHLSPVLQQQFCHRHVTVCRRYMELGEMFKNVYLI